MCKVNQFNKTNQMLLRKYSDLKLENNVLRDKLRATVDRRPIGFPSITNNEHLIKDCKMIIEFEKETEHLIFSSVEIGELFVYEGALYQKGVDSDGDKYGWRICNSDGIPVGEIEFIEDYIAIDKILPKIRRIAF